MPTSSGATAKRDWASGKKSIRPGTEALMLLDFGQHVRTLFAPLSRPREADGRPVTNPPRLVTGQQLGCRTSAGLILTIDEGQCLPVAVADDEARGGLLDRPRRREAALRHGGAGRHGVHT